ncbi:MAG TPA: hypothetical protein VGL94_19750 [Ktedonobacteraceae bacterium]|jgi:hypothetical protein
MDALKRRGQEILGMKKTERKGEANTEISILSESDFNEIISRSVDGRSTSEKNAEWKRSLEARMKRTKVQHSFTLATSQVFRSAKN